MPEQRNSFSLPYSLDAEKAVLGSVLRNPDNLNLIIDKVDADAFFQDSHRHIYQAMRELYVGNEPSDVITVNNKLKRMEADTEFIGATYLVDLLENCPITENVEYYCAIVRDHYYLRRIIKACEATKQKALACDGEVTEFIEDVEKEFLAISNEQDSQGIAVVADVLAATLDELEARIAHEGEFSGVPSLFNELDRITGGWQNSDLIILAARPGMGKTAFCLNLAMNAIKSGKAVAIFTLEMAKTQLMTRLVATEARVDAGRLRKGDISEEEQDRLMHGFRVIGTQESMLGIDETPGISILELRSRCRRFKKEHGLDFVIVDYLQLMTGPGTTKNESREREISEISAGLKNLAKELSIPVMALAQLNRGPDTRPDKIPKLADLRESGSMEQDADQILFLYRDEYYNPNSEDAGKCLVRIAKNRHGSTEDIMLAFTPNIMKFSNLQLEG
jgi:replicative DNA helicase